MLRTESEILYTVVLESSGLICLIIFISLFLFVYDRLIGTSTRQKDEIKKYNASFINLNNINNINIYEYRRPIQKQIRRAIIKTVIISLFCIETFMLLLHFIGRKIDTFFTMIIVSLVSFVIGIIVMILIVLLIIALKKIYVKFINLCKFSQRTSMRIRRVRKDEK